MKRKIAIFCYIALITFFSVYLFFKIQERDMIIKLNNNNLSLDAYRVTLKQNTSLAKLNQKIKTDSNLTDVQVHYRDKKNKNITYFYGKGDYQQPPLTSGHFFANADFESDVPLMVVGKNYEKKLYTPKDQSYLKVAGNYFPVIGVMGDSYTSDLDDQIFIADALPRLEQLKTNNYQIIIDSSKPLDLKVLKKDLGLKSAVKLVRKNFIISNESWIKSHWAQVIGILTVLAGFIGLVIIWLVTSKKRYLEAEFLHAKQNKFIFDEWRLFSLWVGLGMIAGLVLGIFVFPLTAYSSLLTTMGVIYFVTSIVFYFLLRRRIKKL